MEMYTMKSLQVQFKYNKMAHKVCLHQVEGSAIHWLCVS